MRKYNKSAAFVNLVIKYLNFHFTKVSLVSFETMFINS